MVFFIFQKSYKVFEKKKKSIKIYIWTNFWTKVINENVALEKLIGWNLCSEKNREHFLTYFYFNSHASKFHSLLWKIAFKRAIESSASINEHLKTALKKTIFPKVMVFVCSKITSKMMFFEVMLIKIYFVKYEIREKQRMVQSWVYHYMFIESRKILRNKHS